MYNWTKVLEDSKLETKLEEQVEKALESSLKMGSKKLSKSLAKQDRCAICTLKPPWKHSNDITSSKNIEHDSQSVNLENEDHSVSVKFDEEGIAKNVTSKSNFWRLNL